MSNEIEKLLREIAGILSTVGSAVSLLSFAEGLTSHSFNVTAFVIFCATWLILNALLDQFELEVKKLFFLFGIPTSIGALAIASLLLAMP